MKHNIPDRAFDDIISLAKKHSLKKITLFGSRARGTNKERSDIDLAVSGGDVLGFSLDVDYETRTLLMFDVVNLDGEISEELRAEIEKDGVVIYEKV